MTRDINNFNFWCPVEISKAIDENTGEELMLLGGIASTADEDSDGEFLDPKGFDIKPLLKSGMVNWHHQAKTCPGTIVGEPTKAEIRKEGLYIETKLYPSSQVARDIWELAKTLDADSNTRRLGYSIEGRVVSRKSEDKTSPDYKKITKAIITGVAITHQPKNPKTFANIIKGEIDDDLEEETEEEKTNKKKLSKEEEKYYEGVNLKEKSINTTNARPLIKEEVDPKIKVTTFGKAEVMERLFSDVPGISIEKATKIFNLIKTIANMAKRNMVTEEDITKAYDALGLSPESIYKGEDADEDLNTEDEEDEDAEDDDENVKKGKKSVPDDDEEEGDENDEYEDDEETDDESEEEEEDDDNAEKAMNYRFNRIEKAMATAHLHTSKYIKALGVMIKASQQELEKAVESLDLANEKIEEQNDVIKSQQDEISALSQRLESFGSAPQAPKSLRHSNPVERTFGKAQENGFEKGGNRNSRYQQVSIRNKAAVSDLLDQATFSKGYDDEFSKACIAFEATGMIDQPIINRMKSEFGVEIVK